MTSPPLNAILRKTLDDFRLSRGERKVLARILDELDPDDRQLALIRHQAFELAREQIVGPDANGVLDWLEALMKVIEAASDEPAPATAGKSEVWFSPGDQCVNAIVSRLKRTQRKLDICVFTITDNRISDVLADLLDRRIAIRIITDNDKSADIGSDIERLSRLGVPVRVDRSSYHMHHKYAIFDGAAVMTGSYNWTRSAAESNEENFIITSDSHLVREFRSHFDKLWDELDSV